MPSISRQHDSTVPFEFATAARIAFGRGAAAQAPDCARELGTRCLVVIGRPRPSTDPLLARLGGSLFPARLSVTGEPTIDDVRQGAALAASARCDVVIALGGGSVIDTGKAIAALLANGGDPLDYLEVIGAGRALARRAVPVVAIPTTAGSGAEVTRNAVLASAAHGVKASLRSHSMLPRVALVDPLLTMDLPPSLTATTGMDALAQLVEPYLSSRANPLTDGFCREGIVLASRWLRSAFLDGSDLQAREGMSLASLYGGLALANAGLGAVHGFAGPLGGRLRAPHGALCAALLPAVLRVNLAAMRSRGGDAARLARFDHVARLLTGDRAARAEEGIEWLDALRVELGVPRLSSLGLKPDDVPAAMAQARSSSSMRGNPIELTDAELSAILEAAL